MSENRQMGREEIRQRVDAATSESKKTGQAQEIKIGGSYKEERKKIGGRKVEGGFYEEGKGVESILKATKEAKEKISCGNFTITDKKLNEETNTYEYEFSCNEQFLAYAQETLNKPDGITHAELHNFCLNILIARQTGQLEEGVEVKELEAAKRRKFYKKYK